MDDQFLEGLTQLVALQSISTDKKFFGEIEKTVDWLESYLVENGFDVEIYKRDNSNPVVYAEHTVSSDAESVLIYGHYDVQPADKENGWESDPFELVKRGPRMYGRGVVDNKGQFWIHMYTVSKLIKEKKLKFNVKFLIEGNEETSNPDLPDILKDNEERMKSHHVLVSDGEIIGDNPVIETSLRGGFSAKLMYVTGRNNVHSGIYGGAVPNAANELSKFLAGLFDEDNRITVPGFYDDVDEITTEQKETNEKLSEMMMANLRVSGFKTLLTEPDLDYFSQIGLRPTIQITGLKSGYIGDGFANIVPAKAEAKLNFRLAASQTYHKVIDQFSKYVEKNTPDHVAFTLKFAQEHNPVKIDTSKPIVREVEGLLEKAFDKEVLLKPVGGAIPIVGDFKELWGVDTLLVSLGNDDCQMHGPNENFRVDLIEKGLKFSEMFFSR